MTRYGLRDGFPKHKEIKIPFKDYDIKKVSEITEKEVTAICDVNSNYKGFSSDDFDSYWKNFPKRKG